MENVMNHSAAHRPNILVLHRDPLLSAGLVTALRAHAAYEVFAGDVDDLDDGSRIDVVIADYDQAMHLADSAVRGAHSPLAAARILVLTSNDLEADIRRAIEAGINGYIVLGGPLGELIEGVSTVASGARHLGRSVAQRMADSLARESLTSRQIEVLRLIVTGESNKGIARRLRIEVGTVKTHVAAIMAKLGAASRMQAARIAAMRGLVNERELAQFS
jgi:DNA-binding NarL/FixJ family response regulator